MNSVRPARIPEGFELTKPRGPFMEANGPLWRKSCDTGASVHFGFLADRRHTNGLGFVHGGWVATVLDNAMAQVIHEDKRCKLVTQTLSIEYRHAVFPGRWCEIEVSPIPKTDGDILEMKAELATRGATAASARGIYQIFVRD